MHCMQDCQQILCPLSSMIHVVDIATSSSSLDESLQLKETTGGEFRVYRASKRYVDLLYGSYNGSYPPENVLESTPSQK